MEDRDNVQVWTDALNGPLLGLMVSIKQLADVRLRSTGVDSLLCCLTPASLQAIGIILEEILKDRVELDNVSDSGYVTGSDATIFEQKMSRAAERQKRM